MNLDQHVKDALGEADLRLALQTLASRWKDQGMDKDEVLFVFSSVIGHMEDGPRYDVALKVLDWIDSTGWQDLRPGLHDS